jgi:hypothetical protein
MNNDLFEKFNIPELLDSNISIDNRLNMLIKYATIGKQVCDSLSFSVANKDERYTSLDTKLDEIRNDIDGYQSKVNILDTNLNILVGNVRNASFKGVIGENFLEHMLKNYFPNDIVDIKTHVGHETDIHFTYNNYINDTILIESKLYSRPVTTQQLDKFYYDVERSGCKYALFVSLSSPIVGISKLKYKHDKGVHIIFIPNCDFNYEIVAYALYFFKIIMESTFSKLPEREDIQIESNEYVKINEQLYLSEKYHGDFLEHVNKIINDSYEFWNMVTRLRSDIYDTKNSIIKLMDILYKNTYDIELKIRTMMDDTSKKLNNEYSVLKNKYLNIHKICDEVNFDDNTMEFLTKHNYVKYDDDKINFILNNMKLTHDKNYDSFFIVSTMCVCNAIYDLYGVDKLDLKNLSDMYVINKSRYVGIVKFSKTKLELVKNDIKITLKNLDETKMKNYFALVEQD